MNSIFSLIRKTERLSLVILMILLAIVCFMQVFWRLVLNAPLSWSEEVSRYLFVWLTFIGAACAVAQWGHFQVDVLLSICPPKAAKALRWFAYLAIAAFAIAMVAPGWTLITKVARQMSPAMRISMKYPYAALPVSGILMLIHIIEHMINDVKNGKEAQK